jgi:PhoPQ-activated pathogenicity-related protein
MAHRHPFARAAFALGFIAALLALPPARADLESYVKAPDPSYAYEVVSSADLPGGGSITTLHLTSQTWQGIKWEHWMFVVRPEKVTHPESALLVVSGGSTRKEAPKPPKEAAILAPVAAQTGSIIVILNNVPNQPLFDNLKEDALIAFTFKKFIETKDESWPCLFPMTKSAVRAMDAVQAFAKAKFSQEVKTFTVTGASKRGWTTWLTGAMDGRVTAIAPMVIDTLNMAKQMPLQVLSFGTYSEQIEDYTRLNLVGPKAMQDPTARKLLGMVDPYAYLKKLTMPKLIILGTNDRYWPVDAAKLYFGDLAGDKYIHEVPNEGHNLGAGALGAAWAIAAFHQSVLSGEKRPQFEWSFKNGGDQGVLSITAKDAPQKAELWKTQAPTRDFREAKWVSAPLADAGGGRFEGKLEAPREGFAALFAELTYKNSLGITYTLSTNVEVMGDKKPQGD